MNKTRKCILHLSLPLNNFYSTEFWKGAVDEAKKLNYDFLSISGGLQISYLDGIKDEHDGDEAHSTLMYQLPDKSMFDGVVMWGAQFKHDAEDEAIQDLVNYFSPLPIVAIGWEGEHVHSLFVDNSKGMRDMVLHLIQAHDHRKIAYLKNDTSLENNEFNDRYRGYCDALSANNIPIDPNLIIEGSVIEKNAQELNLKDLPHSWAILAIRELIDRRKLIPGKDFTAIAVRDDPAALAAIEELSNRGYKVPEDIAITGFDNIIESRCSSPPLSTVSQPFRDQGALAVQKLHTILTNDNSLDNEEKSGVQIIIRESCGCINRFIKTVFGSKEKKYTSKVPQDLRNVVLEQLNILGNAGRRAGDISRSLDTAAKTFSSAGEDPMELIHILEEMAQKKTINQCTRTVAKVVTADIAQRLQLMDKIKAEKRRETLDSIDQNIFASYDMSIILPRIEAELPALNASACYIVIYENTTHSYEKGRVLFAYSKGKQTEEILNSNTNFPVSQIIPENTWPDNSQPRSFFLQSLHFGSHRIGYILLQDDGSDGRSFFSLALRLSGALEGSFLLKDLNTKKIELEKAYEEILNLSNHDSLTNLSNRRDFERELFAEHRRMARYENAEEHAYSILFIDLDNFKYYNDSFGHDVGDAALIAFSQFLTSQVRVTDIVARYGGDEFVCLLPDTTLAGSIFVAERILTALHKANHLLLETQAIAGIKLDIPQDKLLYCSIGIGSYKNGMAMEEVIKTADDGLYLAKKNGKGCWKSTQSIPETQSLA